MSLPVDVQELGQFQGNKGDKGERGATGTFASVAVETVPAGSQARAIKSGPEEYPSVLFQLPRPFSSPEAVTNDVSTGQLLRAADSATRAGAYVAVPRALGDVSLREWVEENNLPNRENGNAAPLFTQAQQDLAAAYATSGQISKLRAPGGRYGFEQRLTPPLIPGGGGMRGGYGIKGEGMYRTVFLTAPNFSWLGLDQFQVGDPDWSAEKMEFEDFTVDGTLQPVGSSYSSGLKAFILHNIRETVFRRVRGYNTHATVFGIDYSQADLIDCIAEYGGRGRKTHSPDPTTRLGSGAGAGIGIGQKLLELVRLINFIARFNGSAGIFVETLGQPEAMYKALGLQVIGAYLEGNAIGVNDTGSRGSQYSSIIATGNSYAGFRIGKSNASEQGGIDGTVNGLTTMRNGNGIVLEGSAEGGFIFNGVQSYENTQHGIWWRATDGAWPAPWMTFSKTYVHHNGGHGVYGETTKPIIGLDFDGDVYSNGGDDFRFLGALGRPNIRGRAFDSAGRPLSLLGRKETESPIINLDISGARSGYRIEHKITDATKVNAFGLPTSVKQYVTRPVPDASLTGWTTVSATAAFASSFIDPDGVEFGPHIVATPTGGSPRVVATGIPVVGGQVWTDSIDVIIPKGMSMQAAARFGTGGTASFEPGPIVRGTGSKQRVHLTFDVPTGATVMGVAVIGASGASAEYSWDGTKQLRVTRANATRGIYMWKYLAGDQPGCVWDSTPGASTSTYTVPQSETIRGFSFDFSTYENGTLPAGAVVTVNSGSAIPAVVQSGKLTYGTGGTASRTTYAWEGGGADGTLRAVVGDVGELWLSLLARVTDAGNLIAVNFRRSSTVTTVNITKRVANGSAVEVAYTPSVTLVAGDVIEVVMSGTSIEVKVNGATLFGGAVTITEHATVTTHGLMLVSSAVARTESLSQLSFQLAA